VSALEVLAVIGIIGFVIYQQLAGQFLRGKRVVVLPAVVTVIGFLDLRGHHIGSADIAWLTVGAAGSLLIGLALGLNRVGQAAVIVPRAMLSGIPFAPEKDGRTFLEGAFGGRDRGASGRY